MVTELDLHSYCSCLSNYLTELAAHVHSPGLREADGDLVGAAIIACLPAALN